MGNYANHNVGSVAGGPAYFCSFWQGGDRHVQKGVIRLPPFAAYTLEILPNNNFIA
jgi:hypothetical protein